MKKLFLVLFVLSTVNVSFSQPWMNYLPEEKNKAESTNFYDIQNAFNQYCLDNNIERGYVLKNGEKIKSGGWKQFKRWEDFIEPRVYPTGNFPKTILWQELQKKLDNREKTTTGSWVHLGPSDVPTDINYGGNRGVGRVNAIAFHPSNSNILWVGAPSGGFWKSTDGGATWATTTDALDAIGVSDIAVNPNNTDEIYIVTGDGDAYDAYAIGILKSTDGGANWTSVLSLDYSSNYVFRRILINPSNPSIMIASSNGGILRTTNSWSSFTTVQSGHFKDLEFKPGDPNTVYATSYSSSGDAKVYKSTDGGASWSASTTGMSISGSVNRIELAVTAANSSVVYALCSSASDYGFYSLYKSTDSGANWSEVTSNSSINLLGWNTDGQDSGGQGWYDLSLAVSPTNENEIYTGGVNIWKSTNGGSSWSINSHWYGGGGAEYVHADIHTLAYSPSNVLYSGNDGGLYKTSDGGTNWVDISAGLQILQIYKLGVDALNSDVIIVGAQDNGTMKRNGSTWNAIIGGDGMECIVDYTNSNVIYGEIYYGDIRKSTDGGYNFSSIKPSGAPDGAWVTPYVMHPTDHNTLIAGYDEVYQTTNGGSSWTAISSNLTGGSLLKTLTYAPSNPSYIYAATSSGIWKTTNGGSSWTSIVSGLPNNSITDIEVAQNDPETLWVTFSGFDASYKVYKSINGGSSYSNFSTGLPNVPVNCILYENNSNDALYLGCDLGVYYRDGSMSTWAAFDQGLPNVIVRELEIQYSTSKIRAATYGRGLWESDTYGDVTAAPVANFQASSTSVSPGESVNFTDLSSNSPTSWSWTFEGGSPSTSTEQNPTGISYSTNGTYDVILTATNANGSDTETKVDYITVSTSTSTTLLDESFESASASGWTVIDNNGDGEQWSIYSEVDNPDYDIAYSGTSGMGINYNSTGNDDWLITPQLSLPSGSTVSFSFWARSHSSSYLEDFNVKLSTSNTSISSFTTTLATVTNASSNWTQYSYDLSAYAGQNVYLAVQCVSVDDWYLFADDFLVTASQAASLTAAFTGTPLSGTAPMDVTFTDESTGSPTSWSWSFGDGITSTEQNPVHNYANAGTYTVTLTVSDGSTSSTETKTDYISVSGENVVTAAFSGTPTSGSAPLDVSFTDASTGSPTSWSWSFGDGTTSSEQNPVHTYSTAGTYTVALTVSDGSTSDTETKTNYITVDEPSITTLTGHVTDALNGNSIEGALVSVAGLSDYTDVNGNYTIENVPFGSLKAEFIADNVNGLAPLSIQFTDQSLTASQTVTASATGYNTYTNELVEINSTNTVNLDISLSPELTAGQMRFVLNWSSSPNDLDSHLKTPDIEGNSYHVYYSNQGSADNPPYATLDHDVTSGYGPETMTIYTFASGTYHYYVYNYSGSPDITTSLAVVQLYNENGLAQTINIPTVGTGRYWHVFDIDGYTQGITVINQITDTEPGEVKSNEKYALKKTLLKSKDITTWNWNFGDGNTSTEQNPSHTYSNAGQYTVSLQISDGTSTNTEVKSNYINVIGAANSTLSGLVTNAVDGTPIEGALVSVAGLSDYTDANGNYLIENVPAGVLNADFIANPRNGNNPLSVSFYDQSADAAQTVSATADGYSNYVNNQVVINADEVVNLDISLSPLLSSGQMRIVLNWSESPSDLDSHLKTPSIDGAEYHVYYSNQGSEETAPYATLDNDVTSGYGPETITLYNLFEGVYYYYVYQYSDYGTFTESSAVVQIYNNEGVAQTINVPTYGTGRYWNVCTINGNTGVVNIINQIQETEPGNVDKSEVKIKKSNAKNIVSWQWNFGDGFTSTEQNPVHTYSNTGTYTVALTISNETNSITETKVDYIQIWPVFVDEQNADKLISIYPNPSNGIFNFEIDNMDETVSLFIFNIDGKQVYSNQFDGNSTVKTYSIDLSRESSGLYFVKVQTNNKVYVDKLMIK